MFSVKRSEWYDIYHTKPDPSPIYTERKKYSGLQGKVYIKNVKFYDIGNSGVIYLHSSDIQSLISTSSFENSSNLDKGGSIYIIGSESAVQRVCSFGSKSSNTGPFSYFKVSNSDSINKFSENSVFYSNRGEKIGSSTIYFNSGRISFDQNNITNNYCDYNSGFWTTGTSSYVYVNFSLIDKNDANYRIFGSNVHVEYKNSIFTKNKIIKQYGYPGMFTVGSNKSLTFNNCYFSGNNQGSDSLFGTYTDSSSITITKSYINKNSTLHSGPGKFTYENTTVSLILSLDPEKLCSFEKIITIKIKYKSKYFCCLAEILHSTI